MNISERGLTLIKEFESLRLQSYRDPVGIWTIGYGHTGVGVHGGQTIDVRRAEVFLRTDINKFERGVTALAPPRVTQGQFDALVSFAFNVGLGSLARSTLLRLLREGLPRRAAEQFERWNKAGGTVLAGLTRRRAAERVLFESK